jgi:hypothetical protein
MMTKTFRFSLTSEQVEDLLSNKIERRKPVIAEIGRQYLVKLLNKIDKKKEEVK